MTEQPGRSRRAAVFLDRDGTLNRAYPRDGVPKPPASPEQVELLPGVPEALARLKRAGLLLVVVTNQPDVVRGILTRDQVERIHALLRRLLPLDAIVCCYHDDADDCPCRKPRPGMLLEAADRYGICLSLSFLVGDRWRDVEAGRRAGCSTILLRTPWSERERAEPDFEVADLCEAADIVLQSREVPSP